MSELGDVAALLPALGNPRTDVAVVRANALDRAGLLTKHSSIAVDGRFQFMQKEPGGGKPRRTGFAIFALANSRNLRD